MPTAKSFGGAYGETQRLDASELCHLHVALYQDGLSAMTSAIPVSLAGNGRVLDKSAMLDRHIIGSVHFRHVHTGGDLEVKQNTADGDQSLNQSVEAGAVHACHFQNGQPGDRSSPHGESTRSM